LLGSFHSLVTRRDLCISALLSHGFGVISNMCTPRENSKMKVEWTLLTAPVCESRDRVRTVSHIHPCSSLTGAQVAHMLLR
jgi:hypothetical protein